MTLHPGWYALYVRSRSEHQVARHLTEKGYETLLPLHRETRRWSDRIKDVTLPLFPNYVFCRMSSTGVGLIVGTPGVVRIVGTGATPVPIDTGEIDAVRRIVSAGVPVGPWPFLHVGQRVEIQSGPLNGLQGILTRAGNADKLVVSVWMLQRSVAVEIDRRQAVPLAPPRAEQPSSVRLS